MRTKLIVLGTALLLIFTIPDAPAPTNVITSSDERGRYRLELSSSETTNMMPLASYRFADRFYLCSVTTSNFLRGPRWQSDSAEPPLSPGSALAIAERHASRLVPGVWKFKPQEIVLKNFAGVWFYIVELEALDETAYRYGGKMAPIKIPVLMDGTVAQTIDQGEVRDPVGANRLRLKPDQ